MCTQITQLLELKTALHVAEASTFTRRSKILKKTMAQMCRWLKFDHHQINIHTIIPYRYECSEWSYENQCTKSRTPMAKWPENEPPDNIYTLNYCWTVERSVNVNKFLYSIHWKIFKWNTRTSTCRTRIFCQNSDNTTLKSQWADVYRDTLTQIKSITQWFVTRTSIIM